jgi:hypothetical protein
MRVRNGPSIHLQASLRCYYILIARYNNSTTVNQALGEAITQIVGTFTIFGRVMFLGPQGQYGNDRRIALKPWLLGS